MTKLLDKAFARAARLDPEQQDRLARRLLAELSDRGKAGGEQTATYQAVQPAAVLDPLAIKNLLKQAILELMTEQGDVFRELLLEAIEDAAMVRAIDEGMATPEVDREQVFAALRAGS